MRSLRFFFGGFLLMAGCSPSLSDAGRRVQVMKNDPPSSCKEVGPISAVGPLEYAKTWARNEAAERGANYIRWETMGSDGRNISGTAYACPDDAIPQPAAP